MRIGLSVGMDSLYTVGTLAPVATTNTSVWAISADKSAKSFTITLNLPATCSAFSRVRLIRVICLFCVCLMRFSQVFLPILPTPKRRIFFCDTSATFCIIYCTAVKDTEAAPEERTVSFLIRLLALITLFIKRSKKALASPLSRESAKACFICPIISKSPNIWLFKPVPTSKRCCTASLPLLTYPTF